MFKVVHLTSAHDRFDTRIFVKECCSLSRAGYEVSLVVADGKGDEVCESVVIYDVGKQAGRMNRMIKTTKNVFDKAKKLDADLYHIHDPELLPIGLKLKDLGKLVIYDAHEDVPMQILYKPYMNKIVRTLVSKVFALYEIWATKRFDAVIAATPFIRDKFLAINQQTVDVNNYPILDELVFEDIDWANKENIVCYVGSIDLFRGIAEIVQAMEYTETNSQLKIGGVFKNTSFEERVRNCPGWKSVDSVGWLQREKIRELLHSSMAGLVTLHPIVNYLDSLPVKMFEYMAAGIPVIASDFPLWKKIIESHECGICVNPLDPRDIATAIDYLISHPEEAIKMGKNGIKAVKEYYNWGSEATKLLSLYQKVLR